MAIKDLTPVIKHLFLCNGGTCKQKGAEETTGIIREFIKEIGLDASVHTTKTLCNGRCKDGPVVISQPDGIWFKEINMANAVMFAKEFIGDNKIPKDLYLFQYGMQQINSTEHSAPPEK